MKHGKTIFVALFLSASLPLTTSAADAMPNHDKMQHNTTNGSMENGPLANARVATMSSGEIQKIDKDAGKITIKHGPLTNLSMPGMTMVFHVKDPAALDQVQAGDKIAFVAEKVNGALMVTKLEKAK